MRVNIYAEEMSDDLEIIEKEADGVVFTGLRFWMYLPVTLPDGTQAQGKFMHRPGDDDSSAVTFWGKRDFRKMLRKALELLDKHYEQMPSFEFFEKEQLHRDFQRVTAQLNDAVREIDILRRTLADREKDLAGLQFVTRLDPKEIACQTCIHGTKTTLYCEQCNILLNTVKKDKAL